MVIKGANLGFVEGEFRGLSKHELVNNSQLKSKVRMLIIVAHLILKI